jgi:hypothetical protein
LGNYTLTWADSLGHTATSSLFVHGFAASFSVAPTSCAATVNTQCSYQGRGSDASGTPINDPWGYGTLPTNVSCVMTRITNSDVLQALCSASVVGTYTIPFADAQGISVNAELVVGAASNPQACTGTDVSCWIGNLIGAVQNIAGSIVTGVYTFLYVSKAGKSFIDVSPLTAKIFPSVNCRSGQAPTAPDGIHCVPFPFSIPFDMMSMVTQLFGQSPVSPSFTARIYAPPYVDVSQVVNLNYFLTDPFMSKVRDAEFIIFILAVVANTHKFVEFANRLLQ